MKADGSSERGGAVHLSAHSDIIWSACVRASIRLAKNGIDDPRFWFPALAEGSWALDNNQVTAASQYLEGKGKPAPVAELDQGVRAFFHEYWSDEHRKLMERLWAFDRGVHDECQRRIEDPPNIAGFGTYNPFDHLDILDENVADEHLVKPAACTVAATIDRTTSYVGNTRLGPSTTDDPANDARKQHLAVTQLGRGVHTLADFFAHSNFIELLLWSVAVRTREPSGQCALDEGLLRFFNRTPSMAHLEYDLASQYYTPIPLDPEHHPLHRGGEWREAMWYGETPEATPLASCVFDTQDTAYSLLQMYAHYLERARPEALDDDLLDYIFCIMDVSGAPVPSHIVQAMFKVTQAVQKKLKDWGRGAREFLRTHLTKYALSQTKNQTARDLIATAGALLERYDSKEAAGWARAGKVRYVAQTIQRDLALRIPRDGSAALPHHSVLAKDYPALAPDAAVRFNLGCLLATELTTKVLEWHFGPRIDEDVYARIRERFIRHPWRLLEDDVLDAHAVAKVANRMFAGTWQGTLREADTLLGGLIP